MVSGVGQGRQAGGPFTTSFESHDMTVVDLVPTEILGELAGLDGWDYWYYFTSLLC